MPDLSRRWPIRLQLFTPFALLLLAAVAVISALSAAAAAQQAQRRTLVQLENLVRTLDRASFPLTPNVLERMHGLTGAHFVVLDSAGGLRASTLALGPDDMARVARARPHAMVALVVGNTAWRVAEAPASAAPDRLFILISAVTWREQYYSAAWPPLLVGAVSLLPLMAIAAWLANHLARRIRRVQEQVSAIATGTFHEADAGPRDDELRDLVLAVNSMSRQLVTMTAEIRASERARLYGQLAGGLAHTLRNAITGARLALQWHARHCQSSHPESLAVALNQLVLTEEQVRGFLDLGADEPLELSPAPLAPVVEDALLLVSPRLDHERIRLHRNLDPEATALIHAQRLKTSLVNLLLNAADAAGVDGEIAVSVQTTEADVVIEIVDSGPGPAAEVATRLMEPFVSSKPEGVGLGLVISRQTARRHSGELTWERTPAGTCFRIRLPLVSNSDAAVAVDSTEGRFRRSQPDVRDAAPEWREGGAR